MCSRGTRGRSASRCSRRGRAAQSKVRPTRLRVVALVCRLAHQLQRPLVALGHRQRRLPQRPRPAPTCMRPTGQAGKRTSAGRAVSSPGTLNCSLVLWLSMSMGSRCTSRGNPYAQAWPLRVCTLTPGPLFSSPLLPSRPLHAPPRPSSSPRFCGTFFSSAWCQVLPPSADTSTRMMPCPLPLHA